MLVDLKDHSQENNIQVKLKKMPMRILIKHFFEKA